MVKTREDSRIEVWSDQYINNPTHRKDEDRDVAIIQMEYVESGNFIVEIIPKNNITQMVPLKEIICVILKRKSITASGIVIKPKRVYQSR